MKLYKTTYDNKETKKEIDELVGKSYSYIKSFKLGGVGSKRMIISKTSHDFSFMKGNSEDILYGSIELRPKGIIFYIVKGGLKSWAWVIPYFKLNMYHCGGFTVYSNTSFIKITHEKSLKENTKFIDKLVSLKQAFIVLYSHPEIEPYY